MTPLQTLHTLEQEVAALRRQVETIREALGFAMGALIEISDAPDKTPASEFRGFAWDGLDNARTALKSLKT